MGIIKAYLTKLSGPAQARDVTATDVTGNKVALDVKLNDSSVGATTSGLTIAGKITIVPIDDTNWTALPAAPLANRNAICIQNQSATEMKVQFDALTVGYVGMIIPANSERFYDITDSIILYGKCSTGAGPINVAVEEIS